MTAAAALPPRQNADEALRFILSDVGAEEPGAISAIVQGDHIIALRTAGLARLAERAPFTRRTRCRIASLSKPMASQVVLTLVEEGHFDLDDAIGGYLPFLQAPVRDVSIRQLLSMKSGVREDFALARLAGGDGAANDHRLNQRLALIAAQTTLNFAPGARTLYSNSNYALLQRACERLTGERFGALLKKHVFEPAGMESAAFSEPETALADLGLAYEPSRGGFTVSEAMLEVGAAGAVVAAIDDILAWRRWSRGGGAALWRKLVEPQLHNDGTRSGYGLGICHQVLSGRTVHSHAGNLGGWVSEFLDLRDDDTAIIVLSNRNDINWYERAREAAILTLGLAADNTSTPRLARPEPSAIVWTALYGNDERGLCMTFSGAGDELHHEHRRMIGNGGLFGRTLGVEPFWFDAGVSAAGPPERIIATEGNVSATLHRADPREPSIAISGVFACDDLPGEMVICSIGGETMISVGPEWPAPRQHRLRHMLGRLYAACDLTSGKLADLNLLWSADAPDRIELSMTRIERLTYRRVVDRPKYRMRWRLDAEAMGDPS